MIIQQAAVPIDDLFQTQLSADDLNQIQQWIKQRIPTGFNQHTSALPGSRAVLDEITQTVEPTNYIKNQLVLPKVSEQLGTLGGGYVIVVDALNFVCVQGDRASNVYFVFPVILYLETTF